MQDMQGPGYTGLPMDVYAQQQGAYMQQYPVNPNQQSPMIVNNRPQIDPRQFETPTIVGSNKPLFKATDSNTITVDNSSDIDREKRKQKRSSDKPAKVESNDIVKADNTNLNSTTVEPNNTIYTYQETNGLLHETLGQIDAINAELVKEFDAVRHNRTLKNKYITLTNLSENIGAMISNRISTIKEINNCITKANDLDYRKYKDIQAQQSTMNDDKYIADLYQAFMQNPNGLPQQYQLPQAEPSILGSGIVRATINQNQINKDGVASQDVGYLNYVANMSPEQNLMRYEKNPNVKQVVVYDASSGAKFFQMMDMSTGEVINNVPVYDQMFMEDTTLDLEKRIAKNINLNETFPIVIINDKITSQY